MKIGEFLINEKHITQEVLDEALALQESEENLRLGEILVKMGKISEEDLNKYVQDYLKKIKESAMEETSQWLSQGEVDKLRAKYFDSDL